MIQVPIISRLLALATSPTAMDREAILVAAACLAFPNPVPDVEHVGIVPDRGAPGYDFKIHARFDEALSVIAESVRVEHVERSAAQETRTAESQRARLVQLVGAEDAHMIERVCERKAKRGLYTVATFRNWAVERLEGSAADTKRLVEHYRRADQNALHTERAKRGEE